MALYMVYLENVTSTLEKNVRSSVVRWSVLLTSNLMLSSLSNFLILVIVIFNSKISIWLFL